MSNTYHYSENCSTYINYIYESMTRFMNLEYDAFLKSFVVENYAKKLLLRDGLLLLDNWWKCNRRENEIMRTYVFHFCKEISILDKLFEEELKQNDFEVIHIVIDVVQNKVYCSYKESSVSFEELITIFDLKEIKKIEEKEQEKGRNELTKEIIPYALKEIDPYVYVIEKYIFNYFIDRFFKFSTNFDLIWYNPSTKHFHIGEIKAKTKNDCKSYYMNEGEHITYKNILKNQNNRIKISYLCLLLNNTNDKEVYYDLMKNKEKSLLGLNVTYDLIKDLKPTISGAAISEFSYDKGIKGTKVVKIPFSNFNVVLNFKFLGENEEFSFTKQINYCLQKYSYFTREMCDGNQRNRHFMLFATLFKLKQMGFDFDFEEVYSDYSNDVIVTINGKKVYFKFFEKTNAWVIRMNERMYQKCIEEQVDYILVFGNNLKNGYTVTCNGQKNNILTYKPTLNVDANLCCVNILGYVKWEDFQNKHLILPKGCHDNQTNIHLVISGQVPNVNRNKILEENLYFLQVKGEGNFSKYIQQPLKPIIQGFDNDILDTLYHKE